MAKKNKWLLLVKKIHDEVTREGKLTDTAAMVEALKRAKKIYIKRK